MQPPWSVITQLVEKCLQMLPDRITKDVMLIMSPKTKTLRLIFFPKICFLSFEAFIKSGDMTLSLPGEGGGGDKKTKPKVHAIL